MAREEVIKWLKQIKTNYIHGGDESFDESRKKALDTAIRSLEAWDKVIEEIENHRRKTKSIDKYDLVGDCLDIIKNYMKEVEE